ncbi:MAG: hypothetical protein KGN78_15140, partial [Actinomycetales bacterium]|nr:hypothetical protein [Actinomycetales bacterium]
MTSKHLLALALLTSCGPTVLPPEPLVIERGIAAEPSKLILGCVTPGCDTTTRVTIQHLGDRRLAIKRIILSEEARQDFSFTSSQPAPFIFGVGSSFTIDLRYAPREAPVVSEMYLAVTYTDASAIESADRVEPGELRIPLVRRLVGQPSLVAKPARLQFGVVAMGTTQSLPLKVENDGYGNVAIKLESIQAPDDVMCSEPSTRVLLPKGSVDLNVSWTPSNRAYLKDTLTLSAGKSELAPTDVEVEGTSIADARIAVSPEDDIHFDQLPLRQQKKQVLEVMNQGGQNLSILSVTVDDASETVAATLP